MTQQIASQPPSEPAGDAPAQPTWMEAIFKPGLAAMLALTIVGGAMRFIRLSQPPLLYDEAAVYTRVVGSLREMNQTLRYDGFPPLHYELYWLLARFLRLTPVVMRIIQAIAGTLMIPAMYFLARQMFSRRVATLAAAITCFSAYQLVYSRDAKMYMELWLCATIFIACLLWWMRTGVRIAWLSWVATGCAMNGLHGLGFCVVGVGFLIVLVHPALTKRRLVAAVLGFVIASSGALGYYAMFNQWGQQIHQVGWHTSGLEWIEQRGNSMSKPFVAWDTLASWVLAYRSPRPPITPPNRVIAPVAIVSALLILAMLLGALPWPKRLRDDDSDEAIAPRGPLWMTMWLVLPAIGFAMVPLVSGHEVWSARYLAIVWPALAVLMALLIQRLPARWLRAGAIGLLIGANVLQYVLRVSVESGVPVDKIAHDLATAKKSKGAIETIVAVRDDPKANSLGGGGGIFDFPGRYYLSIDLGLHLRPGQLRDQPFHRNFSVPTDVSHVPSGARELIVWADDAKVSESADPVLAKLGASWSRVSSQEHAVRDFWCWRRMFRCTRSVYTTDNPGEPATTATSPPPAKKKRKHR